MHALKPSSLTLVTVTGINIGRLIGGALIVESIFALPGIGRLLVGAIYTRDLIILQGVVLLVAAGFVIINFVVDMLYAVLDPEDPPWPRLSSTSTRRSSPQPGRRGRAGSASLFWVGGRLDDACLARRDLRRRAAAAEPDRHGHAGAARAVLGGALARHRRARPRRACRA